MKMAIWVPLNTLSLVIKDKIADDLTVVQLDETYEKMKARGRIMPGYTVDPDKKIYCFNIEMVICGYHIFMQERLTRLYRI